MQKHGEHVKKLEQVGALPLAAAQPKMAARPALHGHRLLLITLVLSTTHNGPQVLRLLENDQVTPEEVEEALRDPLEYYLQSSTEAGACNADMRTVVLVALVGWLMRWLTLEQVRLAPQHWMGALHRKPKANSLLPLQCPADYVPDETIYDSLPMMKEVGWAGRSVWAGWVGASGCRPAHLVGRA